MNSPTVVGESSVRKSRCTSRRNTLAGQAGRRTGTSVDTLEVIALLAIALLLILGAVHTSGTQGSSPSWSRLEVQAGDTLWTLAAAHPVEGLTTAQAADLLATTNHVDGGLIVQGQTLLVPAASAAQRLAAR
jgi:LysM repeat protein